MPGSYEPRKTIFNLDPVLELSAARDQKLSPISQPNREEPSRPPVHRLVFVLGPSSTGVPDGTPSTAGEVDGPFLGGTQPGLVEPAGDVTIFGVNSLARISLQPVMVAKKQAGADSVSTDPSS